LADNASMTLGRRAKNSYLYQLALSMYVTATVTVQ